MFRIRKITLLTGLIVAFLFLAFLLSEKETLKKAFLKEGDFGAKLKTFVAELRGGKNELEAGLTVSEAKRKFDRLVDLKNRSEAALTEKTREAEVAHEALEKKKAQADAVIDQASSAKKEVDELKAAKDGWFESLKNKFFSQAPADGGADTLPECSQAGLAEPAECELYLRARSAQIECKLSGVETAAECKQLHLSRYGRPMACEAITENECDRLVDTLILGDFVAPSVVKQAGEEVAPLVGRSFEISANGEELAVAALGRGEVAGVGRLRELKNIFPLALERGSAKVFLHPSPVVERLRAVAVPAVLQFDDDGDGLPNEIERRLGTDASRSDSDGDGYGDGEEAQKGFNPIGAGAIIRPLSPAETALVGQAALEQPKLTGETSAALAVDGVENIGKKKAPVLRLEGRAQPNEVVSLFIYSAMPIVVSVETDRSGNWIFDLDKSLVNGRHEAYLVVNDEQGRIKSKSEPYSFFINAARAVTQDDYLAAEADLKDGTSSLLGWYAAAGAAMILFAVGLLYLSQRTKKKY